MKNIFQEISGAFSVVYVALWRSAEHIVAAFIVDIPAGMLTSWGWGLS